MSAQHTPTPWKVFNQGIYHGIEADCDVSIVVYAADSEDGEETHAGVQGKTVKEAHANAEFIVRAANFHEELVELLRLAFQTLLVGRLDHDLRARISIALAKAEDQS